MSEKKTWLGRVFASIASLFITNYEKWLKKLWDNIAEDLKPDLVEIVYWIEDVKHNYIDSPILDAIVLAFPGTKDDAALAWLRKISDILIKELRLDSDLKVSELTKSDKQSIATILTQETTGMSFDQSSQTIKTAYHNTITFKQ